MPRPLFSRRSCRRAAPVHSPRARTSQQEHRQSRIGASLTEPLETERTCLAVIAIHARLPVGDWRDARRSRTPIVTGAILVASAAGETETIHTADVVSAKHRLAADV